MMKSIPVRVSRVADVAALAADDPALQLVGFELDRRDRRLHGVPAGNPLHAGGEDAAGAPVGVVACLLLHLPDQARALVAKLLLELPHQDLLGLARAEPSNALQLAQL